MKQELVIRREIPTTDGSDKQQYAYLLGKRTIYTSKKIMNQEAQHLFDIPF